MSTGSLSLDAAAREVAAPSFGSEDSSSPGSGITPADWRENLKLIISGALAGILWVMLACVVGWHVWQIAGLSGMLASITVADVPQAGFIDRAVSTVNDTAKTLYAFLAPLAAGVTGYFFNTAKEQR